MAPQEIEHTQLPVRGINLHVAQVGKGESESPLASVVWSSAANPCSILSCSRRHSWLV